MNSLKTILNEIFGLFVDDGSFAAAILFWLIFVRWFAPHFIPAADRGIVLFLGLALMLAQSAIRYANRRPRKQSSSNF